MSVFTDFIMLTAVFHKHTGHLGDALQNLFPFLEVSEGFHQCIRGSIASKTNSNRQSMGLKI